MASFMTMYHEEDPAEVIRREVGDLKDLTVMGNQVLIGIYQRPNKTKGGIIITDKTKDEDKYQGKVGLILAMGPRAFKDEKGEWFGGIEATVGDWVFLRVSDGWSVEVNGKLCRMVDDTLIKGIITHPDVIW